MFGHCDYSDTIQPFPILMKSDQLVSLQYYSIVSGWTDTNVLDSY